MTDFKSHDQWLVGNDYGDYFFVAHEKMKEMQPQLDKLQKKLGKEMEKKKQQIQQLEQWTNLKYGETIFDSDVDNWLINETDFDDKIIPSSFARFIILKSK